MAKNSRGKRPCSICRKWFPDVRQKDRQKTCGPACQDELHRRLCEKWNRKNKAVHKDNYLAKKLEDAVNQQTSGESLAISSQRPLTLRFFDHNILRIFDPSTIRNIPPPNTNQSIII